MCEVQTEYREQMQAPWEDPEQRRDKREESWQMRCAYLEGKLAALNTLSLSLVRLVTTTIPEASTKEDRVIYSEVLLNTVTLEPPGAPSQGEAAAQFADGWKEMRGTLKCELHD